MLSRWKTTMRFSLKFILSRWNSCWCWKIDIHRLLYILNYGNCYNFKDKYIQMWRIWILPFLSVCVFLFGKVPLLKIRQKRRMIDDLNLFEWIFMNFWWYRTFIFGICLWIWKYFLNFTKKFVSDDFVHNKWCFGISPPWVYNKFSSW